MRWARDQVIDVPDPQQEPFLGLRRNARALTVGSALLIGILFVVPDVTPRTADMESVKLAHGRIIDIQPGSDPPNPAHDQGHRGRARRSEDR